MGKHSKNNNDRGFFSNAERKAAASGRMSSGFVGYNDFREWGWGTETRTLDSDSMKDIDACSLSLQPCAEPMLTPSGVLYDRGVIIEYILTRKREIEAEMKKWEAQEAGDASEAAAAGAAAQEARIAEFVAQQEGLSQADIKKRARDGGTSGAGSSGSSSKPVTTAASMGRSLVADGGKHAADTSFWVTTNTPSAKLRLSKPDSVVRCPVTNEPLKLKNMIKVSRRNGLGRDGHSGACVMPAIQTRRACPRTPFSSWPSLHPHLCPWREGEIHAGRERRDGCRARGQARH